MDQQLPKTNADWAIYYNSILEELTENQKEIGQPISCLLYTSPSPRD